MRASHPQAPSPRRERLAVLVAVVSLSGAVASTACRADSSSRAPPAVPSDPAADLGRSAAPVVREEQHLTIAGVPEVWRLEWTRPPDPACVSAEESTTCPCVLFAYGESGDLELVRSRPGAADERLSLTSFFDGGPAILPRWQPPTQRPDGPPSPDLLAGLPTVPIMRLRDYDHDGQASEFVLVLSTEPCGFSSSIVVGVSTSEPALHVFGTAEAPNQPLILARSGDWEQLAGSPRVQLTEVACGDHGSDQEESMTVTADGRLHARTGTRKCP